MFWHVVLGLLRDGRQRHGYELRALYLNRSGTRLSTGNFYREVTRLAAQGLVRIVANPPDADGRRIPYEITDSGRDAFDQWLLAERRDHDDLYEWMLFLDRVPAETRDRILGRRLEDCWIRNKLLVRAREDARSEAGTGYDPRFASITRQMKQVAAEIDFIEELCEQIGACEATLGVADDRPGRSTTRLGSTTSDGRRGRGPVR